MKTLKIYATLWPYFVYFLKITWLSEEPLKSGAKEDWEGIREAHPSCHDHSSTPDPEPALSGTGLDAPTPNTTKVALVDPQTTDPNSTTPPSWALNHSTWLAECQVKWFPSTAWEDPVIPVPDDKHYSPGESQMTTHYPLRLGHLISYSFFYIYTNWLHLLPGFEIWKRLLSRKWTTGPWSHCDFIYLLFFFLAQDTERSFSLHTHFSNKWFVKCSPN